ncbi:MAG: formylglycine-generating enzyme family protein [Thermoguttaceae bacterium]|nr:formylglycine-generating enzyme family protein [Thermoguttaceae bacterium]
MSRSERNVLPPLFVSFLLVVVCGSIARADSGESAGRAVAGFDQGERAGDRTTLTINGAEFAFRYCPPGEFLMGSGEEERARAVSPDMPRALQKIAEGLLSIETRRKVVLTKGFWLMETELTQAQWEAITGENPSHFKGANLPVETISWRDCDAFVNKLNEELRAAPEGWRFRLPTEAQWEYACRAGSTSPFPWGDSLNGDRANCDGSEPYGTEAPGAFLKRTRPVGSYGANAWGFCDTSGNVSEWVLDYFGEYPSAEVVDPARVAFGDDFDFDENGVGSWKRATGLFRIDRGGSWKDAALNCRSAGRFKADPDKRDAILGARLALVSDSQK